MARSSTTFKEGNQASKGKGRKGYEWEKKEINWVKSRKILLWGIPVAGKNEWYEKQIPRIFEYPIKSSSGVYIGLNEYNCGDGLVYYRFKEVMA